MKSNDNNIFDILIIGAGPGGMTAAIYAARAMAKIVIIEKSAPGGKVTKTSEIENYPGFDLIMGADLAIKMFMQTQNLNVPYIADRVIKIIKNKKTNIFSLKLFSKKIMYAKAVIIATGTVERKIGVPGEVELYGKGVSYCAVCDGALYKNKDIAVVGGGYGALEEAIYLTKFVNKLYLIHRRQGFRTNKNIIEKAKSNSKIEFILDSVVTKINSSENDNVKSVNVKNIISNKEKEHSISAIFPYIGSIPISDFAKDLNVLDKNGYFIIDKKTRTSIPGLFAAGDVTNTTLRQIVTATSDGAKAAQFAIEYIDNLK